MIHFPDSKLSLHPANRTPMWCDTRSHATAGDPDHVGEKGGAKYHQLLFIRGIQWRREGSHQRVGQKGVVRTIWFVISLLAAFYGASEVSWGAVWLAKSCWCLHPTIWYPTARRNYFRVDIGTETLVGINKTFLQLRNRSVRLDHSSRASWLRRFHGLTIYFYFSINFTNQHQLQFWFK